MKKNGFTLIELLIVIAIIGILFLGFCSVIYKVFIAKSVNDGVQMIKQNAIDTTSLKCVDAQGREMVFYAGLKNACRTSEDQFKITSSDGTVRLVPAIGCSPSCAGNSPADCGQNCQ